MNQETTTEKSLLFLWGFTAEEIAILQAHMHDVQPVPTDATNWPDAIPVVVHQRAVPAFRQAVDERPDGDLPDAVLYRTHDEPQPMHAWMYFDMTVNEGDWAALEALATEPGQFYFADLAYALPADVARTLDHPLEEPDLQVLPLSEADRIRLATSEIGLAAFNRALEQRRWAQRLQPSPSSSPSPEQSNRGYALFSLSFIGLTNELHRMADAVQQRTSTALAALISACLQTPQAILISSGAGQARSQRIDTVPSAEAETEAQALLRDLSDNQWLSLRLNEYECVITKHDPQGALKLGPLYHGGLRIDNFRVELRYGDKLLWSGNSENKAVFLPLTELEQALQDGANQLLFLKRD